MSCLPCQNNGSTTDCNISDGDCVLNADGTPVVTAVPTNACPTAGVPYVADEICSPWDMTQTTDTYQVDSYIDEQLNIAGAILNVYKLLGIHEQGKLVDLIGNGNPISSGSLANFPSNNAFEQYQTEWRSAQTGKDIISKTFIGYDFGPIKLDNGRDRFGIETLVKYDISMIKLKQGCNQNNRVTKIRVERSNDGVKWYGVSILDVPDCDGLVTLTFSKTVPSRFWRIRPILFNGGVDDYWVVQALQLIDYEKTDISNIQDRLLLENRDRDYLSEPIKMKCHYTPVDVQANASKFGFMANDVYTIQVSFGQAIRMLGRPFVVGDIVQLPSETQYTATQQPVLKYLEISDVAWSSTSYSPSWTPTMQRLLAVPAMASQETQQVLGKLTETIDATGLTDTNDGMDKKYQDISNISKTVKANANTKVPERGQDNADIAQISDDAIEYGKNSNMDLSKLNVGNNVYSEDGLPPNGLPYTEGEEFPPKPKNNDYHRMTYDSKGTDIPPRLFKFLGRKGYWIHVSTDRRYQYRKTKPSLQEFVDPTEQTSIVVPAITPSVGPIQATPLMSLTPTISTTPTITPTISITPTITPTISLSPTITPTISLSPTVTPTLSNTPTITPTISTTPTITPTISNTPSVSATATPSPTITPTISLSPTITPTPTPTASITPSMQVLNSLSIVGTSTNLSASSISIPTGTVVGDLLLLVQTNGSANLKSVPSGFTPLYVDSVSNNTAGVISYRYMQPGDNTFTINQSYATLVCVRKYGTTVIVDGSIFTNLIMSNSNVFTPKTVPSSSPEIAINIFLSSGGPVQNSPTYNNLITYNLSGIGGCGMAMSYIILNSVGTFNGDSVSMIASETYPAVAGTILLR